MFCVILSEVPPFRANENNDYSAPSNWYAVLASVNVWLFVEKDAKPIPTPA